MANSFAYNVVPPSGSALIAQATAANPIVFVESLSCASAAQSDDDLASKNKAWYTGKTGQIQAVSATNNRAHIVCRYTNAGSEQVAKSIAITARLASQADSDAVILCAKSDPDSDARLPGASQIGQFVEFGFTIDINGASTVTATPGASATMADLDRFVSMHQAGNPNAGDAQSIRGVKDFLDDVYLEGTVYGDGSRLSVANNIYPDESVNYSLGTQSLVWEEVWGASGFFGSVYVDSIYKNSSDISAISVLSDISMYANIIPGTTNTYALGDSTHAFSEGNFTTLKAGNTMTSNLSSPATDINLRNPLIPFDNTASLGSDTNGFTDLYLDGDQAGGGNIYNSPHPYQSGSSVLLRAGANLMIAISYLNLLSSDVSLKAGSLVYVGNADVSDIAIAKVYTSSSNVVTFGRGSLVNGYYFRLLSDIQINAGTDVGYAYAVCVGEV